MKPYWSWDDPQSRAYDRQSGAKHAWRTIGAASVALVVSCVLIGVVLVALGVGRGSTTRSASFGQPAATATVTDTPAPTATHVPTPTPDLRSWQTLGSWQGQQTPATGTKTSTLHIPAGARLVWSCQPINPNINPDTYGFFSATLYGSDGKMVDGAGSAYGYGRGAYTFRHEGDYYLSVDAVEESWSMTLQVFR